MQTTVLVFHPRLATGSRVNARLMQAAQAANRPEHPVEVRDLYALYPDFRINVKAEQDVLTAADRIVWQFPMYWYSTPALLKQWEDDVLEHGWAYGSTGTALHGKELGVAVSPGGAGERYAREGAFHYTLTELLRPLQATSNLIGTRFLRPFITTGAMAISDAELASRAAAYPAWLTGQVPALGDFE
ncbi:Putative NADPH-quinone reductase (modulator of drug activity B) [Actinomyces ruminicola]|uniref:Putative NADPH-quinone reductase (Modulator of drug activity B) n=1 Tax=Actinomyces ruminicola TaxID=332524 RepID=A0A1G9ZYW6_9ACTO|nr:NAD(P)H-dependent oxidoreductase [Actinomyces ruminicola]SDN26315.1 Putative NADPH-quinone reductase (modulator of drug activity B) [Actinomyces ruminicola]